MNLRKQITHTRNLLSEIFVNKTHTKDGFEREMYYRQNHFYTTNNIIFYISRQLDEILENE
jgi:hypothetical protein